MSAQLTAQVNVLLEVLYAMLLAGSIGVEREIKNRPAGFRTHMLVGGAAAFLVGIGDMVMTESMREASPTLVVDPFRLVEAVIAGVSFIGAGTIFAQRGAGTVVGITTAASLLMVAVIGVAVGFDYNLLAFLVTAATLSVLVLLAWIERLIAGRRPPGGGPHRRTSA
ncbi:MgtC/SapB family protein [Pseudoxanthomonas sp.]|jgi:putative Mg2+ transporter-C (MgtC) family protein|uniref:MgtC/SapB family protein n=1 Tax=Pseudoxanthomonas sp. TaxID=1871049 RepID=UPI003F821C05